jgi:hypothetical protein
MMENGTGYVMQQPANAPIIMRPVATRSDLVLSMFRASLEVRQRVATTGKAIGMPHEIQDVLDVELQACNREAAKEWVITSHHYLEALLSRLLLGVIAGARSGDLWVAALADCWLNLSYASRDLAAHDLRCMYAEPREVSRV